MVGWLAATCPYCRRKVTWDDRLEWTDGGAIAFLIAAAAALGSLGGWLLFRIPGPVTAAAIALAVCVWYSLRLLPCRSIDTVKTAN